MREGNATWRTEGKGKDQTKKLWSFAQAGLEEKEKEKKMECLVS